MPAPPHLALAAYRALLRIYPRRFRQRFEPDLVAAFADLWIDRASRGSLALARLLAKTVIDVATTAFALRFGRAGTLSTQSTGTLSTMSTMSTLLLDLTYALRTFRRTPAFTAVVVVTLALGIGATTAIFSLVHAALLRPLPYPNADELQTAWVESKEGATVGGGWIGTRIGERLGSFGALYLGDLRARLTSFISLEGMSPSWTMTVTRAGEPGPIETAFVSDGLVRLLGLEITSGRDFTPDEHKPGAPRAVIVSDSLWARIGGQGVPDTERVTLDGLEYTVVGVARELQLPGMPVDALIPFVQNPFYERRFVGIMIVLGRLRPDVSGSVASAELQTTAQSLARDYPETSGGKGLRIVPLHERFVRRSRALLSALFASVGLLILIGCANVANLLLVRASARQREIAVRSALGAGRLRIVRQLVTESIVLSLAGAVAGLLVARWTLGFLAVLLAEDLPPGLSASLDPPVLIFTSVVALATGVLFGLAPAFQASRGGLPDSLRQGSRAGAGSSRLRGALVVAEVALATVLVAGSGLLVRSLVKLTNVDPGFRTERVVSAGIFLSDAKYPQPADKLAFFERAIASVQALPGVESAGIVNRLPLGGATNNSTFVVIDGQTVTRGQVPLIDRRIASIDYFRTLSVPLVAGRFFDSRDTPSGARVAIVNRTMAKMWGGTDPIGRRVALGTLARPGTWLTIVGVVGDVRHHGLGRAAHPELWVPSAQAPVNGMVLVARTRTDPAAMTDDIRGIIRSMDPEIPAPASTMEEVVTASVQAPRSRTLLVGGFALLALALAAIGIYGVVSYAVSRMTRDIGVRMALGARTSDIRRLILRQGLTPVVAGLLVGTAAALLAMRAIESMLFEVTPGDPLTLAAVTVGLLGIGVLACLIPARRAARVDPVTALRME
jgi:putative ABC transport system permease protein